MVLKINEQTINLKFDNGAAYTVISASVLDENFCDERAEYFEKILLEKAQQYEQDNELKAPLKNICICFRKSNKRLFGRFSQCNNRQLQN